MLEQNYFTGVGTLQESCGDNTAKSKSDAPPSVEKHLPRVSHFCQRFLLILGVVLMSQIANYASAANDIFAKIYRQKIEDGIAHYYSAKYQKAADSLSSHAREGNSLAAFLMGMIYTLPWSPLATNPSAEKKATYFLTRALSGCGGQYWRWRGEMTLHSEQEGRERDSNFSSWFIDGIDHAERTNSNCVNFYPLLLRLWSDSIFARDINPLSYLVAYTSLDVPLAVELLAAKGIHLDGYAAHFFARTYATMHYDELYNSMRRAQNGPPLPGDEPKIWFGACDEQRRATRLEHAAETKHPLKRIRIRFFWDNLCQERRRERTPSFWGGIERLLLRERGNKFALCVLLQFDTSRREEADNCFEKFPPDLTLVKLHANKAISDGDFSAHVYLSEIKTKDSEALQMLAENSLDTRYELDQALAWVEKNASEYFWKIASFCKVEINNTQATKLLDCYRESLTSDIKCLTYTDYYWADNVREIRASEFYRQCRIYMLNHKDI